MHCLECHSELSTLDAAHLESCCGLTLQEYALRHGLTLESLVPAQWCDRIETINSQWVAPNSSDRSACLTLSAMTTAGGVREEGDWQILPGDVRQLDTLLWFRDRLQSLGFVFRQEYTTANASHRVVARNHLKRPKSLNSAILKFTDLSEDERREYAAIVLSSCAVRRGEYLFLRAPASDALKTLMQWLTDALHIDMTSLESVEESFMWRTTTAEDTQHLIEGLLPHLRQIPEQELRLHKKGVEATIVKQQGIDAAHFITDHPGACANLHGGHYSVHFKIRDRIDPATGFVMDYAELKQIVQARITNVLDHHTLNYAAPELAWRSSTEFLAIWMWERLIDYLPTLQELEIHETQTSYCQYRGPSLEEYQQQGPQILLRHFQRPDLGQDRQSEPTDKRAGLRLVSNQD